MTDASDFVVERIKHRYLVDTGEFDATFVQKLFEQILCSSSKTGILKERVSRYGKFLSCSFDPRCKHKETLCDQCGSPMSSTIKPGYQACINEECGDTRPVCKKCGSEMVSMVSFGVAQPIEKTLIKIADIHKMLMRNSHW